MTTKASPSESSSGRSSRFGRVFLGARTTRDASRTSKGSGAPSAGSRHRPSLRLGLLVAIAAATFLLVPAAQAAAAPQGTLTVDIEGTEGGAGEVSSVGGYLGFGPLEGATPIECTGPPASNVCST
ncbi:MAG TPA: hypothetical protein VHU14_03450, partial [Solirubrobacterales bacterium]|nr:hypothetical protein [Solirubrobacterales bacterium]